MNDIEEFSYFCVLKKYVRIWIMLREIYPNDYVECKYQREKIKLITEVLSNVWIFDSMGFKEWYIMHLVI